LILRQHGNFLSEHANEKSVRCHCGCKKAAARTGCHETGDNFSGANKLEIAQASLLLRVQLDLVRDGYLQIRENRTTPWNMNPRSARAQKKIYRNFRRN